VVICLERGADLLAAQLMPLPLTVSCFSKIQIGFTFLILAHPGSPGKGPLNGCVCMCVSHRETFENICIVLKGCMFLLMLSQMDIAAWSRCNVAS